MPDQFTHPGAHFKPTFASLLQSAGKQVPDLFVIIHACRCHGNRARYLKEFIKGHLPWVCHCLFHDRTCRPVNDAAFQLPIGPACRENIASAKSPPGSSPCTVNMSPCQDSLWIDQKSQSLKGIEGKPISAVAMSITSLLLHIAAVALFCYPCAGSGVNVLSAGRHSRIAPAKSFVVAAPACRQ